MSKPHLQPGRGPYTQEHTQRWSRTIGLGQAYVFMVPEYNHSYNAATKNALGRQRHDHARRPVRPGRRMRVPATTTGRSA
jgi:NAD(P)H-dependent FMN reductase